MKASHLSIAVLLMGLFSLPAPGRSQGLDTLSFTLHRVEENYVLRYQHYRFPVLQEWLRPAQQVQEEEGRYVSSFTYSEAVTAFPLNDSLTGLHLSSYEIQQEGSAAAAAGRDVFLVLDVENERLYPGLLDLGVTKERVRFIGCFSAQAHRFLVADIDGDGQADLGVLKEEIRCEEVYDAQAGVDTVVRTEEYHPRRWHLFARDHWVYAPAYKGRLPLEGALELPLIDMVKSPVDYVRGRMIRNHR